MTVFAKIAKIAIFAKIANLQGATFSIQFKSPAAGDFSPFSPLHAFLDISGKGWVDEVGREYEVARHVKVTFLVLEPPLVRSNLAISTQLWIVASPSRIFC